jgi:transposase
MEDWVTIRTLKARNPSMGSRAIAGLLGISRNTVKTALAKERAPEYQRQKLVNPEIAPFAEFLTESYLVKRLRISRILEDLRSKGFQGSKSALYRWIEQELKPQRQAQTVKAFQPYETKPAEQIQYDWAEYRVPIASVLMRVYVHLSILGYSRYKVFDASLDVHQGDIFGAIEEGYVQLGGTAERIQVDNARVFVQEASRENFRWNGKFLQFCGYFGVSPCRSSPYHPWSKGKVEKPFDHLEAHFIQGNCFDSFEQFHAKLKEYEARTNSSVHSVTHKSPAELFELERKLLRPLPTDPSTGLPKRFVGVAEQVRSVSSDCLICYGGNRYSVPHQFVRSQVWVRVRRGVSLEIYSQKAALIASHRLCTQKGQVIVEKRHYSGYRKQTDRDSFELSAQRLRDRFSQHYPRLDEFLQSLKAQKRLNPDYNLMRIVGLFEYYDQQECIAVMQDCFRYNCFSAAFLQGVIAHRPRLDNRLAALPLAELHHLRVPTPPVKRSLKEYQI